jgi:hypothetical protein
MCAVMHMSHLVHFTFYMSDFDQNWNGMIVSRKILPYQIHENLFRRSVIIILHAADGRADGAILLRTSRVWERA